jgi:hypothetical protein
MFIVLTCRSGAVMRDEPYQGLHHARREYLDSGVLMEELRHLMPLLMGECSLCS